MQLFTKSEIHEKLTIASALDSKGKFDILWELIGWIEDEYLYNTAKYFCYQHLTAEAGEDVELQLDLIEAILEEAYEAQTR